MTAVSITIILLKSTFDVQSNYSNRRFFYLLQTACIILKTLTNGKT